MVCKHLLAQELIFKPLLCVVRLLVVLAFSSLPMHAAEFTLVQDNAYRCGIEMKGRIETGDAKKLERTISEMERSTDYEKDVYGFTSFASDPDERTLNICLEGEGGNYNEAIELMDLIHGRFGTVIRSGARCASACALVFMSGGHYVPEISTLSYPVRLMHVNARLGFHAPSLPLPVGVYDEETVAAAYRESISATSLLLQRAKDYHFDMSLLIAMFATPANEMLWIDKVRQANRWGVKIIGITPPSVITPTMVKNICNNRNTLIFYELIDDPWFWYPEAPHGYDSEVTLDPVSKKIAHHWVLNLRDPGPHSCYFKVFDRFAPTDKIDTAIGFVNVDLDGELGSFRFEEEVEFPDNINIGGQRVFAFELYTGSIDFKTLSSGQLDKDARPDFGTCAIYELGVLVSEDSCDLHYLVNENGSTTLQLVWSNGHRSRIRFEGRRIYIDGEESSLDYGTAVPPNYECYQKRLGADERVICFKDSTR